MTSVRHSLVRGISRRVDGEVARVIREFEGSTPNLRELDGFVLSKVWSKPPPKIRLSSKTKTTVYGLAIACAEEWRLRITCAVRGRESRSDLQTRRLISGYGLSPNVDLPMDYGSWIIPGMEILSGRRKFKRLVGTLMTIDVLISLLNMLSPARTKSNHFSAATAATKPTHEYCSLCWRPTEFRVAAEISHSGKKRAASPRIPEEYENVPVELLRFLAMEIEEDVSRVERAKKLRLGGRKPSRKFCHAHSAESAAYSRDRRFQLQFNKQLEDRYPGKISGQLTSWVKDESEPWGKRLRVHPWSSHPEDVRRAAYAAAESKLTGLRGEIFRRRLAGESSGHIAHELGIPRSTEQYNWKEARRNFTRIERIARTIGTSPYGRRHLMHQFDQASPLDLLRASVYSVSASASTGGR